MKIIYFWSVQTILFAALAASAQQLEWGPIPPLPPVEKPYNSPASNSLAWESVDQTTKERHQSPRWQIIPEKSESLASSKRLNWQPVDDPYLHENFSKEQEEPSTPSFVLTPPPALQSLDRSIAFNNGLAGPDISWNIPNGLRWSERWFGSASFLGQSRRSENRSFDNWNGGDAVAIVHANILQAGSWSVGLNTSFRSVNPSSQGAGSSSPIGEGVSSGFRIATSIGNTGGIAFGGEQVVQWDNKTDTGRNLYLMATKGWWLGNDGQSYPLAIANGGIGTGRFANQDILSWENPLRFACINDIEDRKNIFATVDNDLCWSPIGTLSLVFNEYASTFVEYRSGTAQAAASVALPDGFPMRFTWGVNFAGKNEILETDDWTWVFRASLGF